jgi:chromosomal replication initiation ATPase DnaA
MTPRQKNLAAIDAIAQEHGYTVEDILGKSRTKHLVAVRRLCILMLREKNYSTTEIGRVMDRDHSSAADARARISCQWPLARKRGLADQLIDNRGSLEQLHTLLQDLTDPAA